MPKLLVAAFGRESLTYARRSRLLGLSVRVLDCFESHHHQLSQWFGDELLHVQGRRSDVRAAVAREAFDAAIVHEDDDFIRTALVTQSLREAGVHTIIVVTSDAARRTMYRRCGAHRIIVARNVERAWLTLNRHLPTFATA